MNIVSDCEQLPCVGRNSFVLRRGNYFKVHFQKINFLTLLRSVYAGDFCGDFSHFDACD